jgi:hypothetical protein
MKEVECHLKGDGPDGTRERDRGKKNSDEDKVFNEGRWFRGLEPEPRWLP